jgi:hypothetical protein
VLIGEDKLREELLDVTLRPGELFVLSKKLAGAPAESREMITRKFVEDMREDADSRVSNLLALDDSEKNPKRGLHFSRLLKDMVKNGGSLPGRAATYMQPHDDVALSLKRPSNHAVVFDQDARVYRFNTPADMRAAASLC